MVMIDAWPLWNDLDCRALRKRLGLSQRQFAHRFNFPVSTLRQWEQGKRRPSGAALALLHVIAYQPAVATRAVIRARNAAGALQRTD
jgi:DNA-binding transcriptional regulator YiaG